MDDFVCIIREWMSSFAISSNFYELFFGAFFGTLFAFVFAWLKDHFDKKRQEKITLIETRYALEKYLLHIRDTQKHIRKNRDFSLTSVNPQLRAFTYSPFHMLPIFLNVDLNKLLYLVKKNKYLLNSILLTTHQYNKIFKLLNQRNEQLGLINIAGANVNQLFEQTLNAEGRIYPYTLELLKTMWQAREACKKALRAIDSFL